MAPALFEGSVNLNSVIILSRCRWICWNQLKMLQIITVFASRLEITELLWKLNILVLVFSGIFSSGIKTHVDPVVKKCQVNP